MLFSVTYCCFVGFIIGYQPVDMRELKHAGNGNASQI